MGSYGFLLGSPEVSLFCVPPCLHWLGWSLVVWLSGSHFSLFSILMAED